ncbi:MAG: NADH-quinone oxidoreductase subunit NuoF [Calditrichia bacterium]
MQELLVELDQIKEEYHEASRTIRHRIVICAGTGCVANGALQVYQEFKNIIREKGLELVTELQYKAEHEEEIHLSQSGCQGFCQMGPLVTIHPENILYVKVKPEDVPEIVQKTLLEKEPVERLLYNAPGKKAVCRGPEEIDFYRRQYRFVLELCGQIDPEDIREYISQDGYRAARMAFTKMSAQQVCQEILASGLRGRGGGGFPTGKKWELTRQQPDEIKYVICNGDEGDPGAFMDRSIMEGNPHAVIEGMLIAARAIGATEGYIYVRMEYPLAVARMKKAISDALDMGFLGDNIFGSAHSFHLHVMEGAGAFVCGEETALIASIEGKRGMPMPKPPFPAQKGLWGHPTVINNVETLATVPLILRMGAVKYRKIGTENSPGTKTFALTGHVANTGLIEVPFGTTLREIIFEIGGGVTDDFGRLRPEAFKAVQIGGPSGACLTADHLDLPLDFDSLQGIGAMIGSGGLVVMNQSTCMVQVARFFMEFTQHESCGKCVLCREGTRQMLQLLDDIIEGNATPETLELLEELAPAVGKGSLCGLGKTAPNPVLSTLKYFREEVEAHVFQKRCPAGKCQALLKPYIVAELCKGCGICARKCPVEAIHGEKKQPYYIDDAVCIKCGACLTVCRFNAVKGA